MFGLQYKTLVDDLVGRNNSHKMGQLGGENLVYESPDMTRLSDNGIGDDSSYEPIEPNGSQYPTTPYTPFNQTVQCGNVTCNPEYEMCPPSAWNSSVCNGTEPAARVLDVPQNVFHLEYNHEMNRFTVPVYGFLSPAIVVFTIITNTLVCVVLMKRNMRSPTNLLLFAMALSDMFTGVIPVPCFIYFYTSGRYKEWVPYNWCLFYSALVEHIPTIFHTASIFLTVALAGQRYIYVCHSMKAIQLCTMKNSVKTIIVIYIVSTLMHLCRFFEYTHSPIELPSYLEPNNKTIIGCTQDFIPIVKEYQNVYFNIYFWVRVIFIHIIPCVTLVLLNLLLILAMKSAQARRKLLLMQNKRTECRKLKENNCTTLMLIAVVGLFLLVEIPLAVLLIILIIENTFDVALTPYDNRAEAALLINFFILLSYPVNFFIYCGMSRQFRETFKRLFIPGAAPLDREHSQYMSLATENGGKSVQTANESAL